MDIAMKNFDANFIIIFYIFEPRPVVLLQHKSVNKNVNEYGR